MDILKSYGLTWASLEQRLVRGLLSQRLLQDKFGSQIVVDDDKVQAFMQSYNDQSVQYEVVDYFFSTEAGALSQRAAQHRANALYQLMKKDVKG